MANKKAQHGDVQITLNPNEAKGIDVATRLTNLKGSQAVAVLDRILDDPAVGESVKVLRDWALKHPYLPFTFTSE